VGILLSEKFKENIQNPVNRILINPFFDIYNIDEIYKLIKLL
jgi:hypothetical protein